MSRDLGHYADIVNHKSIRQCNMIAYACIVSRLDRSINAKVMFSIRQRNENMSNGCEFDLSFSFPCTEKGIIINKGLEIGSCPIKIYR